MRNILLITKATFREALSKKIFMMAIGVSIFLLFIGILIFSLVDIKEFLSISISVKGKNQDLMSQVVAIIKQTIVTPLFGIGIFLAIFSSSGFIPSMLEKGNIDLLLSKPIARYQIIIGKYLGGLFIVFLNVSFLIIASWVLIGLKFSNWDADFLFTIPVIIFAFAELYSLVILIGVLTRSSILSMMLAYLIFFILSPILMFRDTVFSFVENKSAEYFIEFIYYITPKTQELNTINSQLAKGAAIESWQPIFFSIAFIIIAISASVAIFKKKDY